MGRGVWPQEIALMEFFVFGEKLPESTLFVFDEISHWRFYFAAPPAEMRPFLNDSV